MIFDKWKMVGVLKLIIQHKAKKVKRNNQLLLCEAPNSTSIGSYRREEKNGKHWPLSTKLLSSVTAFFILVKWISNGSSALDIG